MSTTQAALLEALRDLLRLYDQRIPLRERPAEWEAARAALRAAEAAQPDPFCWANPVIALPDDEDEAHGWTARVSKTRDAVFSMPLYAAPPQPAPIAAQAERCPNCDDTGDVTSIIGEWRGYCHCHAGRALAAQAGPALAPLTDAQQRAYARVLEEFETVARLGRTACIPSAMLNVDALLRAHGIGAQAPASTRPADASISGQRVDMTGWQLVPVEPTQEMQRAAFDELELIGTPTESGTSMRNRVYRAMLAAAPQAPAEPAAQAVAHTSERHFALREAHEIAAEEAFFQARPELEGGGFRPMFNAGFVRGFDAAEKVYATPAAREAGTTAGN